MSPILRLDHGVRDAIPLLTTLLLAALACVPPPLPALAGLPPAYATMAVYYWTLHRPGHLPQLALFLTGLAIDAVAHHPLGLTSLILLVVRGVVMGNRSVLLGQSFLTIWTGYLLIGLLAAALEFGLFWALGRPVSPDLPLARMALGLALFPIVAAALRVAHRAADHR